MSVLDLSKEIRFHIKRLHLECLGGLYRGRGVLMWYPERGFSIEAPVERIGEPFQGEIELGAPRIIGDSDRHAIRLVLGNSSYATSPRFCFEPSLEFLYADHLSIELSRMVFFDRSHLKASSPTHWTCSATYTVADTVFLPGFLKRTMSAEDEPLGTEYSRGAFVIKDDDQHIRCTAPTKNTVRLEWKLRASKWSFRYAWNYAIAAQSALSVLAGQTVTLAERTGYRRKHRYREWCKEQKSYSLGPLSPFGATPYVDKHRFITLAHFFNRNEVPPTTCIAIFEQLAEASRQRTDQARELLTGTILEAALRTLEKKPLTAKEKWHVAGPLKRFREAHWPREWRPFVNKAVLAFENLRHRNAHPDWLAGGGADRTAERITASFDDVQFLVRFYGYMILALAGIKTDPVFPTPMKKRKAPMKFSANAANRSEE